jgi:hypothetical protein
MDTALKVLFRTGFLPVVLALFVAGFGAPAAAQSWDATLHVDNQDPGASDANTGSAGQPLLTVSEAMSRAIANKQASTSTRVIIHPGTYREYVDVATFTNWPTNDPNNATPILVEGADPNNRPVLSGAEVWTNWTAQGNLFVHNWPYDWGPYVAPWQDTIIDLTEIVLRREVVWINDERLDQVLEQANLSPGKYYVDEDADLIYVYPPANVNLLQSTVEIGERERVWDQDYEDHVTLRDLTFEKSNSPWEDGYGLVRIVGSDNVLIEDCTFRQDNWTGLLVARSDNMTLRRVEVDGNGGRGLVAWRMRNLQLLDSEANRNNWRGYLQATIPNQEPFKGWTTGGSNIQSTHGLRIVRYSASENETRGLWFDTDIIDAVVDSSSFDDNLNDGLFIEAVQGPVTVSNSTFNNNFRHGILSGMVDSLTVVNNKFSGNGLSPIRVSGANEGRGIVNFETNVHQTVLSRWWNMQFNEFHGDGPYLIGTTVDATRWFEFIGNLTSDNNDWCHPTETEVFQRQGGAQLTLQGWRSHTGEDHSSTFCAGGLAVEMTSLAAMVNEGGVTLQWATASESNNAGFEVEHEQDGHFVSIGFVEGAGTTSEPTYYTYEATGLPSGANRFRLRQIDVNGAFSYSSIIEVLITPKEEFSIVNAFPNPAHEEATIVVLSRQEREVTVSLFDATGRQVRILHDGIVGAGDPLSLTLDTRGLASGVYLVRATGDDHMASHRLTIVR